jgi:hypothetical protein
MKIRLFGRKEITHYIETDLEFYNNRNFISIGSSNDESTFGLVWPHKIDADNILKIMVDPVIITNPHIYR